MESLIQQKENLKHRILRLRLQIDGSADDSVESVVKRLSVRSAVHTSISSA
jgi:hypothetical protein